MDIKWSKEINYDNYLLHLTIPAGGREAFTLCLFCHSLCFKYTHKTFAQLSKPKLNHSSQLNSTEFEVRLHSYSDIHHHTTTQELSMLLLLLTAQPAAGRELCVQLYSHTQVSGTLHIWASNFVLLKIIVFWKFLPQNPKIFGLQMEGLFIGPSKKIKEFGAIFFFKITLAGKKRSCAQV